MKSQGSGSRCRVQSRGHDGRALERDEYRYRTFLGNKAETCSSRVQPQGMPGVCFRRAPIVSPSIASCNELELLFCYSRCSMLPSLYQEMDIFRAIVIFVELGFLSIVLINWSIHQGIFDQHVQRHTRVTLYVELGFILMYVTIVVDLRCYDWIVAVSSV